MNPRQQENRKHVRFATSGPASLAPLDAPESRRPCTLVDVSFDGVLVEVPEHPDFAVGSKVQVWFGDVTTTGEVRHITERGNGFAVGVRVVQVEVRTTGAQKKQ